MARLPISNSASMTLLILNSEILSYTPLNLTAQMINYPFYDCNIGIAHHRATKMSLITRYLLMHMALILSINFCNITNLPR